MRFALSILPGLLVASALGAQEILRDGFEPGSPSSWNAAVGWSCVDGDTPTPGNPIVEAAGDPGCLGGMDLITNFCIDRYEASLVVFVSPGVYVPWTSYADPPSELSVVARSVAGATPQAYVDHTTALGACLNAGKRLCTDSEWLRACRGPSGWTWPWGDAAEPGRCNDSRAVHPLIEYYQTTEPWIYDHLDQPCLNQLPDGLERTGLRPLCASAEGPFDLYGNLAEWTFDSSGTVRGGAYVASPANGAGCQWVDASHDATHLEFSFGFRCCADLFP